MPGSYVLLVRLDEPARVRFGATGARDLARGRYAYVGSARGPGGFARLDRHRAVARGERDVRHWHVDHLLGHGAASVAGDRRFPEAVGECRLAEAVDGVPVPGVGATDCGCPTHLYGEEAGELGVPSPGTAPG